MGVDVGKLVSLASTGNCCPADKHSLLALALTLTLTADLWTNKLQDKILQGELAHNKQEKRKREKKRELTYILDNNDKPSIC